MKIEESYPSQLLNYLANISHDTVVSGMILGDEYVFATYFAAITQGLSSTSYDAYEGISKIVSQHIPAFRTQNKMIEPEDINQERMMKIIDSLRAQFNEQITTTYVKDFFYAISVFRAINGERDYGQSIEVFRYIVRDIMATSMEKVRLLGQSSVSQNILRLTELLDLTIPEARLLELNLLLSTDIRSIIFRDFLFSLIKNPSMYDHIYCGMLGNDLVGSEQPGVHAALADKSKPITMGIVPYDAKTKKMSLMSEFWVYTLSNPATSLEKFIARFVEPMREKKRNFSGAIAKIQSTKDSDLVTEFLGRVADQKKKEKQEGADATAGHNILFYGLRTLDKMGFVFNMLKDINLKGYKVNVKDAKSNDIPGVCIIAQKYLDEMNDDGDFVLVIDKAEQALSRQRNRPGWYLDMFGDDGHDGTTGKPEDELESDEALLINNPVPTIWLTNSVSSITAENVGRFLIHTELKGGSRKDRRAEVQVICDELGFSPEISQQLSMYHELGSEQIKSAARTTTFMNRKGTEGEQTLVHLISNSQKALSREKTEQLRASVTNYDLDLLNISGSLNPDRIIEALKRNPTGSMCFYGLPGTGKTALAEHIAMKLDLPIMIKPASELLSKWLGESEKLIAGMFEQARSEGSILLLDEADSFLRDRSGARNSWEITQVNEMLQRMERFPGIFICTTNLFQAIDAAALRRFTFKLEFLALSPEQRLKMLISEAGVDINTLSEAEQQDLVINCQAIKYLTPGDFATVKHQANLFGEQLSINEWMRRLEVESKAKLIGIERTGYGAEFRGVDTQPK